MTVTVTVEEQALRAQRIVELREAVSDVLQGDYEFTEHFLVKWLRRNKYDVKKSEAALRKYKSWDVKAILDSGKVPDLSEFAEDLPIEYCGFDKEGCPVLFVKLGKWNIQKYCDLKRKEEILMYAISNLESTIKIMQSQHFNTGGTVNYIVGVVDMQGFSLRQCLNKEILSTMLDLIQLLEQYYPDIGKEFHAVNVGAAAIANILLKIATPFFDPVTLSRLHIYGEKKSTWKATIASLVPDLTQYPLEFRSQLVSC